MSEPSPSEQLNWYGVRCVFYHADNDAPVSALYEERVTVWKAETFEGAIADAESEAGQYAAQLSIKYLGLAQAYKLPVGVISSGTEVFSLIRESGLDPMSYLDRFFDTGTERQQ